MYGFLLVDKKRAAIDRLWVRRPMKPAGVVPLRCLKTGWCVVVWFRDVGLFGSINSVAQNRSEYQ